MERFFMVYDGQAQRGPYSVSQLENFRRNGELPVDALVWTEGMADWQPIASVLTAVMPVPVPPRAPALTPVIVDPTGAGVVKEADYTFLVIAHVLMAASILTAGFLSVVALIMAYIKRDELRGTYLESHCKWIIETFWISFGVGILGAILSFVVIGIPILFGAAIWFVYRVVVGAIRISERRAL
jgi:uncharacterized membrane protein